MISLQVTSLFTNVPTELVLKDIDRRWPLIKKVTKLQIDEFKKGINFLMDSTTSNLIINTINKFLELQWDL